MRGIDPDGVRPSRSSDERCVPRSAADIHHMLASAHSCVIDHLTGCRQQLHSDVLVFPLSPVHGRAILSSASVGGAHGREPQQPTTCHSWGKGSGGRICADAACETGAP